MDLQLITPTGIKRDEEVYEVILPTTTGEIGVLPGHEPLVTLLDIGVMMVRKNKLDPNEAMESFAVTSGIVEIDAETVRILADEAEESAEIAEDEVKAALARAQKMRAEAETQVDITEAERLLKRHTVQLKVAGLRRHHKVRQTWNAKDLSEMENVEYDKTKKRD